MKELNQNLDKQKFNILIACEESQVICKTFREKGYTAFSCDILPTSGENPEWHLQGDIKKYLYSQKWDLVIAHPPCERLCNSGVRWLSERELWEDMEKAAKLFNYFSQYGRLGNKICIENSIPHKHAKEMIGEYSQLIHPWMFGDPETKGICLWLHNLPPLIPTEIIPKENRVSSIRNFPDSKGRSKRRAKTYQCFADAIVNQYGDLL